MSNLKAVVSDGDKPSESFKSFMQEMAGVTKSNISKKDILQDIQAFPPSVKRRIRALRKLQLQATHVDSQFFMEAHRLECQFNEIHSKLREKRAQIVTGTVEPTDEDCNFLEEGNSASLDEDLSDAVLAQLNIANFPQMDDDVKGIPEFWFTIFKNVAMLNDMVQPHDEPILKHLQNMSIKFLEKEPMGFVLEFHFSPNEYFTNSVLTKTYEMKCVPIPNDPFSFEGPEIYKCKGCIIDWHKGKNITVRSIKKRQKHKSRGAVRTVTKTVQNDSFFNFFSPPIVPENSEVDIDEDTQALLSSDFEIGHYIKDRIVPNAILYYTGEALDNEEYEEEEASEEFASDSEEEEEEDDTSKEKESKNSTDWKVTKSKQNPECAQQ